MSRFSKKAMTDHLRETISRIEKDNGFDPSNGYSQVDRLGPHENREYGAYDALKSLLDLIEGGYIAGEK